MSTHTRPDDTEAAFELGYAKTTRVEVARGLGIHLRELDLWLSMHPEFDKEMRRGLKERDAEDVLLVEESMLTAATGFEGTRLVRGKNGSMERQEFSEPPNMKAAEKILDRRASERWAAPPETTQPTVTERTLIVLDNRLQGKGMRSIEEIMGRLPTPETN